MTISHTSPDGTVTVQQITVDGKNHDLPPWIEEQEFIQALQSGSASEPLSSLTSCELVEWALLEDYQEEEERYYSFFKVEFFVPFNTIRELAEDRFEQPEYTELDSRPTAEMTEAGAKVTYIGAEPTDLYEVRAYLLPKDLSQVPHFSGNETSLFVDTVSQILKSLETEYDEIVESVAKWGGAIHAEVPGPQNDPYFLLVDIHGD